MSFMQLSALQRVFSHSRVVGRFLGLRIKPRFSGDAMISGIDCGLRLSKCDAMRDFDT
jgi:hypothetical protein